MLCALKTCAAVQKPFGGIFDFDIRQERLTEVERELQVPTVWNNPERAQELGRERVQLKQIVDTLSNLENGLIEADDLLRMAAEEDDEATVQAVLADLEGLEKQLADLEFRRMFSGEMDPNNAFVDIQSGSGGTEAQDWAEMLLRMYLRWGERRGFHT